MPKRDDPVAPPTRGQEWEIRYADSDAVTGWANLLTQVPGTLREVWERMRTAPDTRTTTQKPLAGPLATRTHKGRDLPQWQLDVSSAGRVWYVIDATTHHCVGHPRHHRTPRRHRRQQRHRQTDLQDPLNQHHRGTRQHRPGHPGLPGRPQPLPKGPDVSDYPTHDENETAYPDDDVDLDTTEVLDAAGARIDQAYLDHSVDVLRNTADRP